MSHHSLVAGVCRIWCGLIIAGALLLFQPGTSKAAEPCPPEPASVVISYGSTVTCAIGSEGDTDIYRFSGNADDVIVAQVAWQSGTMRPCLELIAPDNSRTEACENAFTNRIDTTLTLSGTHSLVVDAFFGGTGDYALALERLISPSTNATDVSHGELGIGQIETAGDLDLFTFDGGAGETVLLQAAWQEGTMRPCIELIAPDNTRTDACENAFTNRIDTTLDQTGVYSVLVDVFFGGSGSYALAFERLIAPSTGAQSLHPGAYVTGEIDPVGDLDLYAFEGSAGDDVILTIAWNSGTMRPCLQLIHPDNSRSTACQNAFSNQLDMKLPITGTYAVLADVFFGGTGKYTLDFQCITGKCAATVKTPIYLPIIRHD